jgi:hypothetical protein
LIQQPCEALRSLALTEKIASLLSFTRSGEAGDLSFHQRRF